MNKIAYYLGYLVGKYRRYMRRLSYHYENGMGATDPEARLNTLMRRSMM
jgi:hypothetical protein